MIREVRPLQPADQNRLREEHKRPDGSSRAFARHLETAQDEGPFPPPQKQARPASPGLLSDNTLWSQLFADLNNSNANDSSGPLFHWGEVRQNAREHSQTARRSALLSGNTPYHILNEKI